ncbi:MBL fold metallo-hydrolase [Vallitalea okinawensis]|uniref:MBL fold metallo-hydrolase n=1 Tax=Vallitalea okinawensis TaxID=2078660 RepID=UPI000CFB8E68|nr:MBL fold metallo-hydrolase [Vallitalea okinawensis]
MATFLSQKRSLLPIHYELSKNISITSTGVVNIHIPFLVNQIDFFPSSFRLKIFDKIIYIDPLIVDLDDYADYILITHSHEDHFSFPDISKLLKKETIILCPQKAYKKLSKKLKGYKIKQVAPEESLVFEQLTIKTIAAYNTRSRLITPHPKSALNVGYIIDADGIKIYHAGDTDYTPEMKKLENLKVILTPIDGDNLTMTTEKAAEFINDVKPEIAIPMHYNIGTGQENYLKGLVNANTQIIIMDGQK